MRLFAYNDNKNYGRTLCQHFSLLGHEARLFTSPDEVPDSSDVICFIRMMHYPLEVRTHNKAIMEELSKKNILLIPKIEEVRLHDDKVKQFYTFAKWMPKTWHIKDFWQALNLANRVSYPIISKAAEGASASNVRFIKNKDEAIDEIYEIFRGKGVKLYLKDHYQKGYILWQEYLHQPDRNDWRVTLIAKKYAAGFERFIRDDANEPFASGSGKRSIFTHLDFQVASLFETTHRFATKFDLSMACVDIVYDGNKNPVILENSSAWGMYAYPDCVWFEKKDGIWIKTKYVGNDMWMLIAKAISDGDFNL